MIESTGLFTDREKAEKHLEAGAQKVIISAPAKGEDITIVHGRERRRRTTRPTHHVISNASCTTNCVVPMAKVLDDAFGIERGLMTTIHAYTNDQNLLDLPAQGPAAGPGRGRSTSSRPPPARRRPPRWSCPQLKGKMDGLAMRVPGPGRLGHRPRLRPDARGDAREEINAAFRAASESGPLGGQARLLARTPSSPRTSSGSPASCTFDSLATMAIGQPGEGHRLVRQRVGVLEPARRPGRASSPRRL